MKFWKWAGIAAAAGLVSAGLFAVATHAQQFSKDTGRGSMILGTLYSSGKDVSIRGVVHGDVFCMGQSVTIEAEVRGDVICAGQDVTVGGTVEGDVRVTGQRVSISADVGHSVTVAGDTVSLDAPANVGWDVTALGNALNIKGNVGRDLVMNGTRGIINGPVARNVTFNGSFLELKKDARIGSDLTYTARSDATIAKEAEVAGKTTHKKEDKPKALFNPVWFVYVLLALLMIGMVVALIAPRTLHSMSDVIVDQWSKPLLVGIAACFALPVLCIVLAVTIVGIPLAVTVLVAWILLALLSGPVAGYWLGRLLLRKQRNVPLRMLLGGAVLVTLYFIPVLGFFVGLTAYWFGSGAILVAIKRRLGKPRYAVPR